MKSFSHPSFRIFYVRYKAYLISVVVFLVSFLILGFVIYPQLSDFLTLKAREQDIVEENQILKQTFDTLSTLSDSSIDLDTQTVKKALPVEKDYLGILNGIASSARDAGIGLQDYSLAVGDISTGSASLKDSKGTLPVTLQISGSLSSAKKFLSLLSQSVPLSSVEEVSYSGDSTEAKVVFYYEIYQPKSIGKTKITAFSANQNKIMQDLMQWEQRAQSTILPTSIESFIQNASASATLTPTVTPPSL